MVKKAKAKAKPSTGSAKKKSSPAPAKKTAAPKATSKVGTKKPVVKPSKKEISKPTAAVKISPAKAKEKASKLGKADNNGDNQPVIVKSKLSPSFVAKQKQRLLELRDHILDQMQGVAQDNLRSRAEGSEGSAFGMHQADAGSDAYEKDFALSLLSQEQDALYEIEEALKRVEVGTYGVCEMSNQPIPIARLEAIPFARFTVQCQEQIEKENRGRRRWDTAPQFMDSTDNFVDEEDEGSEEEDKRKEKE